MGMKTCAKPPGERKGKVFKEQQLDCHIWLSSWCVTAALNSLY